MSKKHLGKGDALPPYKPGTYRLFSMKYCPFAERARLVLHAKGIEYEEVNCNLMRKPDFLLERNPAGLVPVLEKDGHVISESIHVCDLIEELFPENPLYPSDPYEKAKAKLFVTRFEQRFIKTFYKLARNKTEAKTLITLMEALSEHEQILKESGTTYFSGEEPGMMDYMIWPWYERLTTQQQGEALLNAAFPTLKSYVDAMSRHPVVQAVINSKEAYQIFHSYYGSVNVEYDFEDPKSSL